MFLYSYQVQTGTRTVTDYANCTSYSTPAQVCTTPSEQCNYTTVNGVTVRSGCYTPPQSCYTPSPSCMSHWTKQEPVYDTRYHEHAYIHYTYMDWENIDKITTSWNDKRPYWEDDIRYDLDRDDVREWKRIENYTVKVLVNDNNYQDVNLSGDDWNNTEVGGSCVIQKPRWIPINKNDVIQIWKWCDF